MIRANCIKILLFKSGCHLQKEKHAFACFSFFIPLTACFVSVTLCKVFRLEQFGGVTVAEREVKLSELFLFDGAADALAEVGETEIVTYGRRELIYDGVNCPRALGVLLRGRAEAVSPVRDTAVLSTFGPGAVFGAAALFGMEQSYVSRIRSVTECRVQFLSEELLERLFLRWPRTAVNYITFLSSRVRLLNGKIAVLEQNDAEGRLYRYLTENCDENGRLPVRLTMTRLAATLNMGRTSLYRALESLQKKNLIVRKDGKMEVMR